MTPAASWLLVLVLLLAVVAYTAIAWVLSRRPMPAAWLAGLVIATLVLGGSLAATFLPTQAVDGPASPPCSAQYPHCDHSTPAWLRP